MLDSINIETLFQEYWTDSFPMAPANKQSAASHIAFAQYVLLKTEAMREADSEPIEVEVDL
jgi:hypothetical protein